MLGLGLKGNTVAGDFVPEFPQQALRHAPSDSVTLAMTETIRTIISGTDDSTDDLMGDITITFWVRPLWDGDTFNQRNQYLFYLGSSTDVHSSIRIFFEAQNTSNLNRNRLYVEARTTAPSNKADINLYALHDYNSIIGLGSTNDPADRWDSGNAGNVNGNAFTHLAFTRGGGTGTQWKVYWNGELLTGGPYMDTLDNLEIAQDDSQLDILTIGQAPYSSDLGDLKYASADFSNLAIYNKELTSSHIEALYSNGHVHDYRQLLPADSQPALYWKLDGTVTEEIHGHNFTNSGGEFVTLNP